MTAEAPLRIGDAVFVDGCHDNYRPTIRAIDKAGGVVSVSSLESWPWECYPLRMLRRVSEDELERRKKARRRKPKPARERGPWSVG